MIATMVVIAAVIPIVMTMLVAAMSAIAFNQFESRIGDHCDVEYVRAGT